jgi:D-xylose 1-dehydrogenase (NADP+, D-xylono-1,5-lactone-forming)
MVRWGLLGTAHVNRRLIPAMRAARRSSVVAVASRDIGRACQYADEWSISTAHGSYEALIRDSSIDAIYVPLPNSLHVEWTLRALDAGKHVLCEKPLALSADDVDRVAAVARARDRIVEECFMFRHEPLTHALVKVLADDAIGPVTTIASGFTFEQSRVNDVRLVAELGGGSLWDIGCYAVNVVRLVAGSEPIEAFGWSTNGPSAVDESFSGMLRFPGDVTATVHSSFRSSYRMWLEINGRTGTLRVRNPFKPGTEGLIELYRDGDLERSISVEGSPLLFLRLVEDFVAAAMGDRPPVVSLADSRGNAAALTALYESSLTGRPALVD